MPRPLLGTEDNAHMWNLRQMSNPASLQRTFSNGSCSRCKKCWSATVHDSALFREMIPARTTLASFILGICKAHAHNCQRRCLLVPTFLMSITTSNHSCLGTRWTSDMPATSTVTLPDTNVRSINPLVSWLKANPQYSCATWKCSGDARYLKVTLYFRPTSLYKALAVLEK